MISVHFQGKSFNITVIQVYIPTSNAEEAKAEFDMVKQEIARVNINILGINQLEGME